jgi:hypothetical protein
MVITILTAQAFDVTGCELREIAEASACCDDHILKPARGEAASQVLVLGKHLEQRALASPLRAQRNPFVRRCELLEVRGSHESLI